MKLILGLLAYAVAFLGTLSLAAGGLIYVVVALTDRRPARLLAVAAMLCGYVAGAMFVWNLVPGDWTLPFWTTLAATVDSDKYGHPIEHYAEGIVVWMMFGAVVGSVLAGLLFNRAGKWRRRVRQTATA